MVGTKLFQISCLHSPLGPDEVWRIEQFLLKIFEYGNYSFRRALAGAYHEELKCFFYLAHNCDEIIGAAGCLFTKNRPFSAIFSPVAVKPDFRNRGIAMELCLKLLNDLEKRRIKQVYLGVSQEHPARKLYRRLGFSDYTGIVMRKSFSRCDVDISDGDLDVLSSDLNWQHYAEVLALMCEPASLMTFDYHREQFSSRYEPVKRFLPVFPEIMQRIEKKEGSAKIIKRNQDAEVLGLAQIWRSQSNLQSHVAYLEFFVKEGYLKNIESAVWDLCLERKRKQECQIQTWISERDEQKKAILENLGARRVAILPNTIVLKEKMYNTEVFQF